WTWMPLPPLGWPMAESGKACGKGVADVLVASGLLSSGVDAAGALAAARLWPCAFSTGAVAAAGPWTCCVCGACAAAGVRAAAARANAHPILFIRTPIDMGWDRKAKTGSPNLAAL